MLVSTPIVLSFASSVLIGYLSFVMNLSAAAGSLDLLKVPTSADRQRIVNEFNDDLQSYHVKVKRTPQGPVELCGVTCAVCDGIPTEPHWAEWVEISKFAETCETANLHKSRVANMHKECLLNQHTAPCQQLRDCILSPASIIDCNSSSILVCKGCMADMNKTMKHSIKDRKPPAQAIANGFIIGEAPDELKNLNEVELALVNRVRIHAHIWIYFAGCHQQIKGWHTFYKNRHNANVGSISQLQDSGVRGNMMVVLCGPFTSTQLALTKKAVAVDPNKVVAAYKWLVENNIHYKNDTIPDPEELPEVQLIDETV